MDGERLERMEALTEDLIDRMLDRCAELGFTYGDVYTTIDATRRALAILRAVVSVKDPAAPLAWEGAQS